MSPAKKKTRKAKKAPARRKPATRKKPSPRKKKPTSKKKAAKKPSVKKKSEKKKPEKKAAVKKAPAAPKAKPVKTAAKKAAASGRAKKAGKPPSTLPADAHPKLGVKHTCYQCSAKFYDLFRPEPLCPKCGADQREAPKVETRVKPIAKPKRTRKATMAPLLDEEDEEPAFDDDEGPDLDLGQAGAAFDDPTELTEDDTDP